jgi:hypothetical protein
MRFNKTHKRIKIKTDDFKILKYGEFSAFETTNFNLKQLKQMCKHHKLKQSGNKESLELGLYNYLRLSNYASKIQKHMKGYIVRKYTSLKGKGFMNRNVCTNDTDFYTLDNLQDIPQNQFYSYTDDEGFTYGFDILSIFNMYIMEKRKKIVNPYNRKKMKQCEINKLLHLIRLTHLLKYPLDITISKDEMTPEQEIDQFALSIFQRINNLGNYSDGEWFMELSIHNIKIFMNQLFDIWNYRAQLSQERKNEIVSPHGNPFYNLNRITFHRSMNKNYLRHKALSVMEQFITKGINDESKKIGAMYVLSALTLVSPQAAQSLPWLYESVA